MDSLIMMAIYLSTIGLALYLLSSSEEAYVLVLSSLSILSSIGNYVSGVACFKCFGDLYRDKKKCFDRTFCFFPCWYKHLFNKRISIYLIVFIFRLAIAISFSVLR
jgi:hypothetical protein